MPVRDDAPTVPPIIERFVRQLVVTNKAVALYPPSSTIPRDTAQDSVDTLQEALQTYPEVQLSVTKAGLFFDGAPIFAKQRAFEVFAQELYNRRLADVRFHAGLEPRDIVAFLTVLKSTPEEVFAGGGFESQLWDQGVAAITVTEVQITVVDEGLQGEEEVPAYSRDEFDRLLAAAFAGGPRDRIAIAKVMRHPEAVRTYLEETFAITGDAAHVAEVGERFAELAQIAMSFSEEERADLLAALAESLWILDPSLRHDLLADKILPEARTSDALSAIVRQMDVDEVCRMFVDGLSGGEVSKEGLARAVRNLALISTADREDVINAAGLAMSRAGFDQALVSEIQTMAAPSTLTVRSLPGGGREPAGSVETIFRLLDLAPGQEARLEPDDHSLAMLKDEARAGISDGDVISALVSLATMDIREAQFASTMSMIEDSLGLLVARGEIDVAADAAYALLAASERPELSHAQRTRLAHAIERFARPADVRMLADALRLFQPGEPEYEGARRLLDSLGALALQPLLEALADEPDMAARKALVDLLSQRASQHISELGEYVTDPRWYFVRNVVSILGATRSSATIMYLERTLRHADPRVRRETIRALANIADRIATQMLIAGLADDEAQNVQLAARYLGARHDLAAASALETVAKGEGRGNRENGPRVEAIEALGRLGATQSMRTLESLAGKRAFLGAARARELRTAAESAIAAIRAKGGAQ